SWSNFSGGGIVGAFSLGTPTPILSVSPLSLSFNAQQGGSNPASSSFTVTNSGVGQLSMTTASDSAWLTATPTTGTAPQTVQVSVNLAGLSVGTYTGHITVSSAGTQGSPATVTVTLTVTAAPQAILSV